MVVSSFAVIQHLYSWQIRGTQLPKHGFFTSAYLHLHRQACIPNAVLMLSGPGGLKEVAEQAAERQLQRKRKAPEMPTSPFANHKAAHQASADPELPSGSKSRAATGASLGSHAQSRVQRAGEDPALRSVRPLYTAPPMAASFRN